MDNGVLAIILDHQSLLRMLVPICYCVRGCCSRQVFQLTMKGFFSTGVHGGKIMAWPGISLVIPFNFIGM